MRKEYCLFVLLLAAMLALGGCADKEESLSPVDGLDELGMVKVISREEGSGTRAAFAELVGFDESEDENALDATTDTAVIATDAEAVIEMVSSDSTAIGYVSMGAISDEEDDSVKALAVGSAEASLANVKNGNYPLSRPFNLAWSGNLSDLEQDFLSFVLGSGQAVVEESYVTVGDSERFLSGQYSGTISIHGSTSAAPLMEELAEAYMALNTHAVIEITVSDSTTGLNDAMQGSCDLAMASRDLTDYEAELLSYETVAEDGIAVIVNADNPLKTVTIEELKEIFTGTIETWDMINTGRENG